MTLGNMGFSNRRMWRVMLISAAALCSSVVTGNDEGEGEPWISQEDLDAAGKAEAAVKLYCEGGFKGEISSGREVLEGRVGDTNLILDSLKGAENQDALEDEFQKNVDPAGLAFQAAPSVFALLLFIAYFFCCWTACRCCQCCRVCKGRRKTSKLVKLVLLVIGAAIFLGVVISASMALGGYSKSVDGFDNLACTAASLVNGTLGGQANPYFIGLLPLLQEFQDIDESLNFDSGFMTDVRSAIDRTSSISDSVVLASSTLSLLVDAFDNIPAEVAENKYLCRFCSELAPVLGEVVQALDGSVATALDEARREVDQQLSPEMSAELQDTFQTAAQPITQFKTLVRDKLGFFTDTEKFLQVRGHLAGSDDTPPTLQIIVALIIVGALVLGVFMMFTLVWFLCREKGAATVMREDDGDVIYKPSKVTSRCACCTWCMGFYWAIIAFFVGGIMIIVSYLLSSTCLIMVDLNVALIQDIAPAVGLNLTGDEGAQIVDIIDKCLIPQDLSVEVALMDVLYIRDNNTEKITMREKIAGQVKDQINSKFDEIDQVMNSDSSESMASDENIISLINMLANTPIDALIVVDPDAGWEDDSLYRDLFLQENLRDAFVSSVSCPSVTLDESMGDLAGQTINGVDNFVSALATYGERNTLRADCADKVVCTTADPVELRSCNSGNRFVELIQTIRDLDNFKCDLFEDPQTGEFCDPLDMVATYNDATGRTTYSGSCLFPDGTLRLKSRQCTLDEFKEYVAHFGERINKTMLRIDEQVVEVGSGISTDLRNAVDRYIIRPIDVIIDGVTCTFIAQYWKSMVEGMCFQGVAGFDGIAQSYDACGGFLLFMIILMYGLWRRVVDNINAVKRMAQEVAPAAEVDLVHNMHLNQ